jgi:hypothetical protein
MADLIPLRVYIYAEPRRLFALGLWSWPSLGLIAFLVGDTYMPDLEAESSLDLVTPILATANVTVPQTDALGFNSTAQIVFESVALPEDATKLVIASDTGVPILFGSFPPVLASQVPANIPVLLSTDWLFRL